MLALVNDTEIGYDDIGTGLPLVFLHAFPLNRTMWEPQVSALANEWRCIPIDCRGFGESPPAAPASMDRYADDVAGVLDALALPRAVIVGLSMGGYIAFALWRRHRARIRGLVLASTRAGADTPAMLERRRALIDLTEREGSSAMANVQIAGAIGKSTREKRPDVYDAMHRMMAQAPADGVVGALEAMMARPDSSRLLDTITMPTLIVGGDEDAAIPVAEARAMHAGIAGSRLEILENAGHLCNVERPAAFTTVLSEFVGSLLYN